jgi:hypothetical protein
MEKPSLRAGIAPELGLCERVHGKTVVELGRDLGDAVNVCMEKPSLRAAWAGEQPHRAAPVNVCMEKPSLRAAWAGEQLHRGRAVNVCMEKPSLRGDRVHHL